MAMTRRLQEERESITERIDCAFELALGRRASEHERVKMAAHVREMISCHERHPQEPIHPASYLDRTVVEEMSGLEIHCRKPLDVYDDYVPHKKP